MKCSKCGAELLEDSLFCDQCGEKVEITEKKEEKKSKKWLIPTIAAAVALIAIIVVIIVSGSGTKVSAPTPTPTPEPTPTPKPLLVEDGSMEEDGRNRNKKTVKGCPEFYDVQFGMSLKEIVSITGVDQDVLSHKIATYNYFKYDWLESTNVTLVFEDSERQNLRGVFIRVNGAKYELEDLIQRLTDLYGVKPDRSVQGEDALFYLDNMFISIRDEESYMEIIYGNYTDPNETKKIDSVNGCPEFKNLKWGTSLAKIREIIGKRESYISQAGDLFGFYDQSAFGQDADVYFAFEGANQKSLMYVDITLGKYADMDSIIDELVEKYGESEGANENFIAYWTGKKTNIGIGYDNTFGYSIYYVKNK